MSQRYVDGFVLVVPKKNLKAYQTMAETAGKVWMSHGALEFVESVGDDIHPKYGLPFPDLVKPKKTEVILFSFIKFRSRAHRDQVNKKVMKDPRLNAMKGPMPFDVKRMSYGGFKTIVHKERLKK